MVWSGIHGPPGLGTDRSESVGDFQNFVDPGPVRSQVLKFSRSWSGSVPDCEFFLGPDHDRTRTGFVPWIPGSGQRSC